MVQDLERRRALIVGVAIFLAAAALRLSLVETARFTGDEARDYATGMDIAHGLRFPAVGPAIAAGHACCLPGPLYDWMAAAPQLVTRAPEAGNVFFELLGAGLVVLFWWGLRAPFGDAAATFAAVLMAASPWSALFADRVWNPHAFLFFEVLALTAVLRLREEPRSRWAIVLPIACLAMPQIHLAAPIVWLALIPLALGTVRRWNRRYLALGVVLGLALYIPFVIYEARTGLAVTRSVLAETFMKKVVRPTPSNFYVAPFYVLRFLTLDVTYHELTGYWGGPNETAMWHALWSGSEARPFHPLRLLALLASAALVVLCAGLAAREAWRRRAGGGRGGATLGLGPFAAAALLAIAGDMALLALTHSQVFANYVTPTLPFAFVLFAAGARAAFAEPRLRAALLALGVLFCAGGVEATLSISRRIDGRNGLAVHRAAARRLLDDCAAAGRAPRTCAGQLDFGYFAVPYSHVVFGQRAVVPPVRWERGPGATFAYRLQKRADPPPQAAAFPVTTIGAVNLYRLR